MQPNGIPYSLFFFFLIQLGVCVCVCVCMYVCVCACVRTENVTSMTHPFPIQKQVDFEDHTVIHRNLLISVKDLKYPAEHGAVVNACRAEAAFS